MTDGTQPFQPPKSPEDKPTQADQTPTEPEPASTANPDNTPNDVPEQQNTDQDASVSPAPGGGGSQPQPSEAQPPEALPDSNEQTTQIFPPAQQQPSPYQQPGIGQPEAAAGANGPGFGNGPGPVPPGAGPVPANFPPPKSKRGMIIGILVAVIVLIAVGIIVYLWYQKSNENADHQEGKCVVQEGSKAKPTDCENKDAYRIIQRFDDTTDQNKCSKNETELVFINSSDDYILCLKKANPVS